jgi:hypothetical protein
MRAERHGLVALWSLDTIIFVFEGHAGFIGLDQSTVRDGDAVRVSRQIGKDGFRPGERKLRILPIIRGTGRRFAIPIIRFMGSGFLSCARKTPTETDIFA